ncbi:MAG: thioesterase II family protein [Frankia sp.]
MIGPLPASGHLRELSPPGEDPVRTIVCLPFAGGSATSYRRLVPLLPPRVRLLAAQLPGRQDRFGTPPLRELHAATASLSGELRELPPGPLTLFGHSMGALLAWEIANLLRDEAAAPDVVIATGTDAPDTRAGIDPTILFSDQDELAALGGIDPALLANERTREFVARPLRADLEMLARVSTWSPGPVPGQLHVLGGADDQHVPLNNLLAWRDRQPGATVRLLAGGHFFIWDHLPLIVSLAMGSADEGGPRC